MCRQILTGTEQITIELFNVEWTLSLISVFLFFSSYHSYIQPFNNLSFLFCLFVSDTLIAFRSQTWKIILVLNPLELIEYINLTLKLHSVRITHLFLKSCQWIIHPRRTNFDSFINLPITAFVVS
jgi:hypothetical protein